MASLEQAETASAQHDLVSFPDLSGLRATAPSRKDLSASNGAALDQPSTADVVQILHTELAIGELSPPSKDSQPSGSDGILRALSVAWAISLYHIQSHEASTFAFSQLSQESASGSLARREVRFSVDRSQPPKLSVQELDEILKSSAKQDGPVQGDTAVAYLANGEIPPLQFAVLIVARTESSQLSLEIHASSAVHSTDSALFQLRQFEALLRSLLPGSDSQN
ncbi:hypothetical protein CF326_g8854, partial [Tilletia indica]